MNFFGVTQGSGFTLQSFLKNHRIASVNVYLLRQFLKNKSQLFTIFKKGFSLQSLTQTHNFNQKSVKQKIVNNHVQFNIHRLRV